MPKSNKSLIFTFRAGRWPPAFFLLGLLLACGGGGGGDQLNLNGLGCDSMPSAPKTEACAGGQLGTHTFQTETASCSANNGKIIVDDTSACLANTSANRIKLAMKAGDSRILKAEDAAPLMDRAYQSYKLKVQTTNKFLDDFYQNDSTEFAMVQESLWVQPGVSNYDKVFPIVLGDQGNVIASLSTVGDNRVVGYGYDILSGFDLDNNIQGTARPRQPAHAPVIKRVLAWLVKGDALINWSNQVPANLNIAWGSLPTTPTTFTTPSVTQLKKPRAAAGLTALGIPYTNLDCDPLSAAVKDCAAKAQLVVLGASDQSATVKPLLPTQLQRIQEIMAAKIPILYLSAHPSGGATNDWAGKQFDEDFDRLKALGFKFGTTDNGMDVNLSNYSPQDSVASGVTLASIKARLNKVEELLKRLNGDTPHDPYTWAPCPDKDDCPKPQGFVDDIETPTKLLKADFDIFNKKSMNIFNAPQTLTTFPLLALWADAYRLSIKYPLSKAEAANFQRAYVADSIMSYFRPAGAGQPDLGNLLPPQANSIVGSATPEDVRVTLNGTEGNTAIGRFALPGQAITFKFSKAPSAGIFKLYVNTATDTSTKLFASAFDNAGRPDLSSGYRRPRQPQSASFRISTDPVTIVSPYGGMLQLSFSGAADPAVAVQIQGTAKHPFYDTTQGSADANAFLREIQNSKLGWFEIKTPDTEIHSLISKFTAGLLPDKTKPISTVYPNPSKPYFNSATNSIDLEKYTAEARKYITQDAFQLYGIPPAGLELSSHVLSVCARLGWDCTSATIHKKRPIQHFHIDYAAACGGMCSTIPITSSESLNPRGWGESHELGHLLVRFKVYDWKTSEVVNNIYPLHKKWRMLLDLKRDAVGYYNDLSEQQLIFEALKNAYHAPPTGMSQFWAAEDAAWNLDKMPEGAFLNFYTQWPLLYANILRNQNSNMTETDAIEAGWSIYALMHLHLRQINASSNWSADKTKLGFSNYDQKPSTSHSEKSPDRGVYFHHDYLLVALSLITGYDQRPFFKFWGISTNQMAQDQVAAFRDANGRPLPPQPLNFYATRCSDDFRGFVVIDMTRSTAVFPWSNEFRLATDTSSVIKSKESLHQTACLASGRQ